MKYRLIGLALAGLAAGMAQAENKDEQLKNQQKILREKNRMDKALRSKENPEKTIKILQEIEKTIPELLIRGDYPHAPILDAAESGAPVEIIKYLCEQYKKQGQPLDKDFFTNMLLPRVLDNYTKEDVKTLIDYLKSQGAINDEGVKRIEAKRSTQQAQVWRDPNAGDMELERQMRMEHEKNQLKIDKNKLAEAFPTTGTVEETIKTLQEIEKTSPELFTEYDRDHPINKAVITGAPLTVIKYLHKKIDRHSSKGIEYQILYFAFEKHKREALQPLIDYLKSEKRTDDGEVKQIEDRVAAEKKGLIYQRGQ